MHNTLEFESDFSNLNNSNFSDLTKTCIFLLVNRDIDGQFLYERAIVMGCHSHKISKFPDFSLTFP